MFLMIILVLMFLLVATVLVFLLVPMVWCSSYLLWFYVFPNCYSFDVPLGRCGLGVFLNPYGLMFFIVAMVLCSS
jgi:hypothetical protein